MTRYRELFISVTGDAGDLGSYHPLIDKIWKKMSTMLIASPIPSTVCPISPAYIYLAFFQTITEYRSAYLLSSDLMMFVGTCEITRDDEADHDDTGDDNDDSDDVAVIAPGGR